MWVPEHIINLSPFKLIILKISAKILFKEEVPQYYRKLCRKNSGKYSPLKSLVTDYPSMPLGDLDHISTPNSLHFISPTYILYFLRIVLVSTTLLYPYE